MNATNIFLEGREMANPHVEDAVLETANVHPQLSALPPDFLTKLVQAFDMALPTIMQIIALFQSHTPKSTDQI
jgi:hypothetical protein